MYYAGHAANANKLLLENGILSELIPQSTRLKSTASAHQLWQVMAESADARYQQNKKLSVVYLFAVLYWPVFAAQMARKRMRHFSIPVANQVLKEAVFEISLRTKEDIFEILSPIVILSSAFSICISLINLDSSLAQ